MSVLTVHVRDVRAQLCSHIPSRLCRRGLELLGPGLQHTLGASEPWRLLPLVSEITVFGQGSESVTLKS